MHEYLAPLRQKYGECRWCGKRSAYRCLRCGFCYSCHPKAEEIEMRKVAANISLNELADIESLSLSG